MVMMIPDIIDPKIKSNAEIKIFKMLREWERDEDVIVLHSLGLAEHVSSIFGEIDFVVISECGVLCIEIKGGEVKRNNGIWFFKNRYGKTDSKIKGPFHQVQDNMQSLRTYVRKQLKEYDQAYNVQFACCVIMPDCEFDGISPDIIQEVLFDAGKKYSPDMVLKDSFKYWRTQCLKIHHLEGSTLDRNSIKRLAKLLRGDFHFVPSVSTMLEYTTQSLVELTAEQYNYLEGLIDNNRMIVSGVAGTGKTLLAMEQCRRASLTNKKVLYLCYNHQIAAYVKEVFEIEKTEIDVFTIHGLLLKYCDFKISSNVKDSFFRKELPEMFLQKTNFTAEYDEIVVDEGQDLLTRVFIMCIDKFVINGMAAGRWSLFYDPNQCLFTRKEDVNVLISVIKKNALCFQLPVNCRNTQDICTTNLLLTNITQARIRKVNGYEVHMEAYSTLQEELQMLIKTLRNLKAQGVALKEIVLLSSYNFDNSCCCLSHGSLPSDIGRLSTGDFYRTPKKGSVNFYTVQSFKGLEAKVVIILDMDGFKGDRHRILNYIAISRAESLLYIFYDKGRENEKQKMLMNGVTMLMSENGKVRLKH